MKLHVLTALRLPEPKIVFRRHILRCKGALHPSYLVGKSIIMQIEAHL